MGDDAAEDINDLYDGRDVVIAYICDHHPSGVLPDAALKRELRLHLNPEIQSRLRADCYHA